MRLALRNGESIRGAGKKSYQATCCFFPKCIVSHPADENHSYVLLLGVLVAILLCSVGGGAWLEQAV